MARPRTLAWLGAVVPLLAVLSGCLYETTIGASGEGDMTATFNGVKRQTVDLLKAKLQSPSVKVVSADFTGSQDNGRAVIKVHFDDVLKLSTTELFKNATFTRTPGDGGSTVLTAIVRNNVKTPELSDTVLSKLGNELRSSVTFPGDVIESNGTISGGRTVNWTWNLKEFFKTPEVLMTAAYKTPAGSAPAAPAEAGKAPPAAAPAPGGAQSAPAKGGN